jgi:DNA-binding winged helix-turn-helix (wHTH) protein
MIESLIVCPFLSQNGRHVDCTGFSLKESYTGKVTPMLTLILCRSIGGKEIKRDDETRTLLIDSKSVIQFTPTEYHIMLLLIMNQTITDGMLNNAILGNSETDMHTKRTLEKHIENIKSKIRFTGLAVRRIYRYGYFLVAETSTSAIS